VIIGVAMGVFGIHSEFTSIRLHPDQDERACT